MSTEQLMELLHRSTLAMFALAIPLMGSAALIGFAFALFQAVTQIQDQTLPQVIKLVVIGFALLVFGAALSGPLVQISHEIMGRFHIWVR